MIITGVKNSVIRNNIWSQKTLENLGGRGNGRKGRGSQGVRIGRTRALAVSISCHFCTLTKRQRNPRKTIKVQKGAGSTTTLSNMDVSYT